MCNSCGEAGFNVRTVGRFVHNAHSFIFGSVQNLGTFTSSVLYFCQRFYTNLSVNLDLLSEQLYALYTALITTTMNNKYLIVVNDGAGMVL